MMMFLVLPAFAEGLPWECPPITEPADAVVYRETDAGLSGAFAALEDAAMAYWDEECAWVETSVDDWPRTYAERVCEGAVATVTWTESTYEDHDAWHTSVEEWTLVIEVPTGETWTRIALEETHTSTWSGSSSAGGDTVRSAAWQGGFSDLPDDAWFTLEWSGGSDWGGSSDGRAVETEACSFRWSWYQADYSITESVTAPDHTVRVVRTYDGDACGEYGAARASVDGVTVGLVDGDTWARDLSDADGDGYSAGECDCDDADVGANAEAREIPNDGVDQDCDGADLVDWDLDDDGHDALEFGGDDCDDDNEEAFPGAEETAGDGVDEDCDGADDVDADGDGYSADGDRSPGDCDDSDRLIYPGRREIPYDGIDQDCDGVDVTDADGDGEDAIEAGGRDCDDEDDGIRPDLVDVMCDGIDQDCDGADDCPSAEEDTAAEEPPSAPLGEESVGCGGGAAWLALLPLLGTRRRRA